MCFLKKYIISKVKMNVDLDLKSQEKKLRMEDEIYTVFVIQAKHQ